LKLKDNKETPETKTAKWKPSEEILSENITLVSVSHTNTLHDFW
jgi:hypothetical protein